MTMQSGAAGIPEAQWYNNHQQPPHQQVDEKEGLLIWLRGEFAAANAIIDSLCHHLRAVGGPGEYDGVIGSIQQRRCNWNPVLHMQQYFPVTEVVYALQQVGWRREQKLAGFEGNARIGGGGKDFRRGGRGQRVGVEVQNLGGEMTNTKNQNSGFTKSNVNGNEKLDGGDKAKVDKDEKKDLKENSEADNSEMKQGGTQGAIVTADDKAEAAGSCSSDGSGLIGEEKHNLEVSPRSFVATETWDGKLVNIAEGMKLYENLFDDSEISKLITLVNDMRTAGRRGQLHGQTFVISKRPMRGHGREMIQLGVPITDAPPEDEATAGTTKDIKLEPIPMLLQDVIDCLHKEQVVSIKPDVSIIDIFNEGDYSQPHIWPHWYGRPVCVLFLTECEMSFGKVMAVDLPGDYRGSLTLSLSPGSVLEMKGRSADFARHAIPSTQKQRIRVIFLKSQPKRTNAHRFPSTAAPPSNWAPPPIRSPSHHIRPVAAKHFGPVPPHTGILTPQQIPPANGVQPMFAPTPVAFPAPPVTLPPPSVVGWPPAMNTPPRFLVPGTGFFLPSGNPPTQHTSTVATENIAAEPSSAVTEVNGVGKSNSVPQDKCDGSITDGKEEHENGDSGESAEAI